MMLPWQLMSELHPSANRVGFGSQASAMNTQTIPGILLGKRIPRKLMSRNQLLQTRVRR